MEFGKGQLTYKSNRSACFFFSEPLPNCSQHLRMQRLNITKKQNSVFSFKLSIFQISSCLENNCLSVAMVTSFSESTSMKSMKNIKQNVNLIRVLSLDS